MRENKTMLLGIWAIIAITAIILLVILILKFTAPTGAFTQSEAGYELGPREMCEANGCDYRGHVSNLPPSMGPARVDCICSGELVTYQMPRSTQGHYFAFNY